MIVLDTSVVSELLRSAPDPGVVAWVDARDPSELVITAVTAAELRVGVAFLPRGRRRTLLGESVDMLLEQTFAGCVLPFDIDATAHYAEVVAARRKSGAPIAALDAQIAAVCRQHQAGLATRNTRDFAGLGLELFDPWAA